MGVGGRRTVVSCHEMQGNGGRGGATVRCQKIAEIGGAVSRCQNLAEKEGKKRLSRKRRGRRVAVSCHELPRNGRKVGGGRGGRGWREMPETTRKLQEWGDWRGRKELPLAAKKDRK